MLNRKSGNYFSKNLFLIFCLILSSCVHSSIFIRRDAIKSLEGFTEKTYQTKNFPIFTLQKITDSSQPLRIYIEGDGRAYINKRTPALDPTPVSYFLVNLIKQDHYPNIIYIARPCQYLMNEKNINFPIKCTENYWTQDRFSLQVVESINEIIKSFKTQKIELIGYSGGAEIGKYLIYKNDNIINFRTIAGNLDQEKFAQIHKVKKVPQVFSDEELSKKLSRIPQIHFVGTKDKVVPIDVATSYLSHLKPNNCSKIIQVNKATHLEGWNDWTELLKNNPKCSHH